jgi:thiol:disulfide interchange protein DsbC
MLIKKLLVMLALASFFSASSYADEATVKKTLQSTYPQLAIESVTKSPLAGIYEVFANGEIIYADESANFIIVNGSLINTSTRQNLTDESKRKLSAIKWDALPLQNAFTRVKGNGKRKIAMFADPNCGYCKKIEHELNSLNNVTIYTFVYPILSEDSTKKAKSVWCSKDRAKAWNDLMLSNVTPTASSSCDNPVDQILEFGRRKGISGTPTMFLVDGQRIPGAVSAAEMDKLLDGAEGK